MVTIPDSSLQIKDSGSSCSLFTLLTSLLIFRVAEIAKERWWKSSVISPTASLFHMDLYSFPCPQLQTHCTNKLLSACFLASQRSPKCKPAVMLSKTPFLKTTGDTFMWNPLSTTNSSLLIIERYATRLIVKHNTIIICNKVTKNSIYFLFNPWQ